MSETTPACPTDAALASFYAGELDAHEDEAIRDHLVGCAACRERAADAAAFAEAMKDHARRVPVWAMAVAAVFAAAAILVLWRTVTPPRSPTVTNLASAKPAPEPFDARARWRQLPVEVAPYDPNEAHGILWRGGAQPPPATAGSFAWAMEPYSAGDFAGAAERLGRRLQDEPKDERASLYLGVSLLLAERPDDSLEPLRRAAEGTDLHAGTASWYLALACLKTGDEARAVTLLRDLASTDGDRGARARELLVAIEGQKKQ